ncbi:hypothetical protein HaLaN_13819 [Haematococcus lacustris]|uniref:Uncharacterized protein n=1 Tax=Haematococcus lacustris TaxID=44745 RepID=A0A699ZN04_HAELA|nr:hypothetical protein HaLaN_13819 [Haematococcus lacustris]
MFRQCLTRVAGGEGALLHLCMLRAGSVTAVSQANSQSFNEAASTTSKAVSNAVAAVCGGQDVSAAASALAQATATATAKAVASAQAVVTVQGAGSGCASASATATAVAKAVAQAIAEAFASASNGCAARSTGYGKETYHALGSQSCVARG